MQIIFNGKTYNSLEEMPADERQAYEQISRIFIDKNGNGIPDFLEGDVTQNVMTAFTRNFNYNGQVYNNLQELPPEAQEKVQKAFDVMQRLGIVPAATPGTTAPDHAFEPAFAPSKPLLQQTEPVIQENGGRNWMMIVGFLALLLVCAAGFAMLVFFLR